MCVAGSALRPGPSARREVGWKEVGCRSGGWVYGGRDKGTNSTLQAVWVRCCWSRQTSEAGNPRHGGDNTEDPRFHS